MPEVGTVVIEPVENGWVVRTWVTPDCADPDCPTHGTETPRCAADEEEKEDPTYDPSAAFAESLREHHEVPTHQTLLVGHMNLDGPPVAMQKIYVFNDHAKMMECVGRLSSARDG